MKTTPLTTILKPHINNPKLADVIFHVGRNKEKMYGHRFVLSVNSNYLMRMFFSKQTKHRNKNVKPFLRLITLPHIEPETFLNILEFCYLRKTTITNDNVFQILKYSRKFELKELQQLCQNYLMENLNDQNALMVYQSVIRDQQKKGIDRVYKYIVDHSEVFKREKGFVGISYHAIRNILRSKDLCVQEKHLANRVIEYILDKCQTGSTKIHSKQQEKIKKKYQKQDIKKDSNQKRGKRMMNKDEEEEEKRLNRKLERKKKKTDKGKDYDQVKVIHNTKSKHKNSHQEVPSAKQMSFDPFVKKEDSSSPTNSEASLLEKNNILLNSNDKNKKLFDTVLFSKITKICDNRTITPQTEYTEEPWLETDLILMEKCLQEVNQLSLARCLTAESARLITKNSLKLLSLIQWQRFLKRKYVRKLAKCGLFDEEKLNWFLEYSISDGNLSIIGGDGIKKVEHHPTRSRKVHIKRSHIKVMLLAAHSREKRRGDVVRSIKSTGISHVTEIDLCTRTPSILELKKYDVLFVYSLAKFRSPRICGNVLADYVDNGGSVVICSINCLRKDSHDRRELRGRLVEQDYLPIKKGNECKKARRILGRTLRKNHHIMNGVMKFDGGKNSWNIDTKRVTKHSKIIAKYDNGNIMIAEKCLKNRGKVILLNFFPISDSVRNNDDYWNTNTDGQKIIANSVEYAYLK
ncbi:btb/poz domain-containing protein [Anaeramoeba flamelloides]|uniref:Btb/poz domain-containing protein n=1 Tax=Anaeramoeba flamelloides TaxID=1746091 RepID=A0AAV7ZFW1_9EUKA|nr:btb/poz domain-containing protein [Anaeramoeba flamelloides]